MGKQEELGLTKGFSNAVLRDDAGNAEQHHQARNHRLQEGRHYVGFGGKECHRAEGTCAAEQGQSSPIRGGVLRGRSLGGHQYHIGAPHVGCS